MPLFGRCTSGFSSVNTAASSQYFFPRGCYGQLFERLPAFRVIHFKCLRHLRSAAIFSRLDLVSGGGQGGGRPGEKGVGGVREAGEEGAGSGRKSREKLRNIAQYFAIEKMQRGGSQKIQGGNRDYRVREVGGLNPPVPPPHWSGPQLVTHVLLVCAFYLS